MHDLECPYCGNQQDVCHDDGHGYEEDVLHEATCDNCGKNFVFATYISYSYTTYKADCLNGENHKYKLSHTYPKEFSKMRCEYCGIERDLTDAEKIQFKIPQFEKIFKGR